MVSMKYELDAELEAEAERLVSAGGIQEAFTRTLELFDFEEPAQPAPELTHHGARRMRERHVSAEVVAQTVRTGTRRPGRDGAVVCEAFLEGVRVVVDPSTLTVITVISD